MDDDENKDEVEEKELREMDVWEGPLGQTPPDVDADVFADAAPPPGTVPVTVLPSPPDWCVFDPGTANENTEVNKADDDEGEREGGAR